MKNLIYIASLLFFLSAVSCSNKKKNSANDIEFQKCKVDTAYHLFGDSAKAAIKIKLKMDYPVRYKDDSTLSFLQQLILKSVVPSNEPVLQGAPKEILTDFAKQKIAEYQTNEKAFSDGELPSDNDSSPTFEYEYYTTEETVFNKNNIFCFSSTNYSFTGGAHGLQTVAYTCVDLEKGKIITESDLFVDDYVSLLTPILLEKLAENQQVKSTEELENNGFNISEIKPNGNFFLDEKGITYFYNPYDIAAYVMGASKVFIPYSDISFLLAPNSPIKRF